MEACKNSNPFVASQSISLFIHLVMTISLDQIRSVLSSYQPQRAQPANYKLAAVLILLFLKNEELHVLLTRRTKSVEHHKGQISFPGGAIDDGDADAVSAALREAEEEIGLPRVSVEVLGVLDHYATPSRYTIAPVVGFRRSLPTLAPSSHEVAEIFDVPLSFFLDKKNERIIPVKREGQWREVYFYNYGEHEIWGVTAAIIRSFLQTVNLSGTMTTQQ
jgi:8-oxo-dGTP pyrophosphatase MutT (NUDIX family)